MLVTFTSDAYENIVMFGDVAKRLLILMGHSGTIPGAIMAEDISQALRLLEQNLQKQSDYKLTNTSQVDKESLISLSQRAYPLINMLKQAELHKCNVMWR